jgi:Clp protease
MRLRLAAGLVCLGVLVLPVLPALGMQFQPIAVSTTEIVLDGRGPIVPGDTDRLIRAVAGVPQTGRTLLALALDSGGGNVAEAKQMIDVIRSHQLPVMIPRDGQCASACFLLLAASPRRFAATDALVGVHSASQNGAETDTSLAVTTLMARDAAELGVPPLIIGKMVQTTPGRVEWLDQSDLALMHVTVFEGDALAVLHRPDAAQVGRTMPASMPAAPMPAGSIPVGQPSATSAFTVGRNDRRTWDAWLGGLRGAYRDGAVFAQTRMNDAPANICYGPDNTNRGDFTLGCEVARQRLAPLVSKLRSNADYATGWNAPVPAVNASEPVEQEYQGVYFCGRQVVHLTLKVFQRSDDARRRGLFVFGPNDNSTDVPRGSFAVEGVVDLNGGTMTLTPVKWVLQPPGYSWFGLTGGSDDGGKTFGGRLTESSTCTRFTLARVRNSTAAR